MQKTIFLNPSTSLTFRFVLSVVFITFSSFALPFSLCKHASFCRYTENMRDFLYNQEGCFSII